MNRAYLPSLPSRKHGVSNYDPKWTRKIIDENFGKPLYQYSCRARGKKHVITATLDIQWNYRGGHTYHTKKVVWVMDGNRFRRLKDAKAFALSNLNK